MTSRRALFLSVSAGVALSAVALLRALPSAQAPNQAVMTTQEVAEVKFSTLRNFVVERLNPPDRNDSYVVITFDSFGRLVVSKENEAPRILLDNNKDGVYESEKVVSERVRNCQGLWFEGRTLYGACSQAPEGQQQPAPGGGGLPAGIFKMEDTNGDDVADTFETVAMSVGGIQEHGTHAIRRGPDGQISFMSGNHATIADEYLDPHSLVVNDKDVQFIPYIPNFGRSVRQGVHSAVYRVDPANAKFTVLFGGNRNSYDFAYNLQGEAFLFDSDMEWDLNVPWYREVRTVHGIPGGNYGYRDGSGKYPAYYIDSLPPLREVGRGSPVGVEFYQHYTFPREFFDNLLEADWSRGRLLYTALTPNGATYTAREDRAEFVHGEPFNITDLEVGPDGNVYFTTGGRQTSGGVWRVRYTGPRQQQPDMSGILAVVRQPQPLSSWGWAAIEAVKAKMGASFGAELERVARNAAIDGAERARALGEMQRHGAPPGTALLSALAADPNADLRAAAVYIAGVQGGAVRFQGSEAVQPSAAIAAAALKDTNALVRRRAAEALVRMGQSADRPSLAPVNDIYALLGDGDRFVRWAGRLLLERTTPVWKSRVLAEGNVVTASEAMVAYVNTSTGLNFAPLVQKQLAMMQPGLPVEDKLRLYRAFMHTVAESKDPLGDAQRRQLQAAVIEEFPANDERLNRELALLLAYAGQPAGIGRILAAVPKGDDNQPLQLHYLYALRVVKQGWTAEQKLQLAELLGRAAKWRGGAQFVNFVSAMYEEVAPVFATDEDKALLYAKAPELAPFTAEELAEMKARQEAQAAAGRGGRGRGGVSNPLAARRGRGVLSRQEMLEEAVYQPQQQLDVKVGQQLFETNCASCHQLGALGVSHGVPGLNLTSSTLRSSKYALLEAIMFPDRKVAPEHETTIFETTDGRTIAALVLKEGAQSVAVLTRDGVRTELPKAQIKSRRKEKTSLMTEAMADAMNQSQWRHLLAFLTK
jgi:putative heme-binding domain-containing protein